MTDRDPLSSALAHWQPEPAPSPDFNAAVHRRLKSADRRNRWARIPQFPATLPLAAGIAIMLGVVSAWTLNRAEVQDHMADAYARSIDPVRMTASSHHP